MRAIQSQLDQAMLELQISKSDNLILNRELKNKDELVAKWEQTGTILVGQKKTKYSNSNSKRKKKLRLIFDFFFCQVENTGKQNYPT